MKRTKFWLAVLGLGLILFLSFGSISNAAGLVGGKLAVTPVGYDDMAAVLKKLGQSPEEITFDQMASVANLEKYDAVYINCSSESGSPSDAVVSAVKQYVENGGVIYASDWSAEIIAKAFPGKINFYQAYDDGSSGSAASARVGDAKEVSARVVDSGLASVLNKTAVTVNYDLPSWVVVDSAGPGTRVLMTGDVPVSTMPNNSAGGTLSNKPLVLSFSSGQGEVLYTTFHNEAQVTKDVESIINWFGIRTRAGRLAAATRSLVVKGNDIVLQEIVDGINKGETKTYYFNATGKADFNVILNFGGSTLGLAVTDPTGKKVASQDVSTPPFKTLIPSAAGKFKIEVTGTDVSETNYPFVLLAYGPKAAAADEIVVGTEKASTTSSPSTETLQQKIVKVIYWIVGIVVAFIILIILVIVLLIRRSQRKTPPPVAEKKE